MASTVLGLLASIGALVAGTPKLPREITDGDLQKIIQTSLDNTNKITFKNKKYNTIEIEEEMVDENREYKDFCTTFVVKEFFAQSDSLYAFIFFVYNTFDRAITMYKTAHGLGSNDILFLFKGGNIMRIVSNEFLLELPQRASKRIHEYYDPFFKRSDADFGIYINPALQNFQQIFDEMTTLSFFLQIEIRKVFDAKLTNFFDFFKYNQEYKQEILARYLTELQKTGSLTNPENKKYYGKKITNFGLLDAFANNTSGGYQYVNDEAYEFSSTKGDKIVSYNLSNNNSEFMYISFNRALQYSFGAGGEGERQVKFNLVRTKINFNLVLTTADGMPDHRNMGGELIDVSISHIDSTGALEPFFADVNHNVSTYNLQLGDKTVKFKSFSLAYLIHDLELVLFLEEGSPRASKPWDDNKYAKRINRLIYLYYIDLFIKIKTNTARKRYLMNVRDYVIRPLIANPELGSKFAAFARKYRTIDYEFNHIIRQFTDLLSKMQENPADTDAEEFQKYLQLWDTNLELLISTFDDLSEYCAQGGQINEDELYEASMDSVV